jgi:hypothetical protein
MASPSTMLQAALIRFNNRLTRWRRVRVAPDRLLLLAAHCLQASACGQRLNSGVEACKGCGLCPVKDLKELAGRFGIRCVVASGGRQAMAAVKEPWVSAVVAVACEKELMEGILASFPKPVLAVSNTRPKGNCHDTQVQQAAIEAAIREVLQP